MTLLTRRYFYVLHYDSETVSDGIIFSCRISFPDIPTDGGVSKRKVMLVCLAGVGVGRLCRGVMCRSGHCFEYLSTYIRVDTGPSTLLSIVHVNIDGRREV